MIMVKYFSIIIISALFSCSNEHVTAEEMLVDNSYELKYNEGVVNNYEFDTLLKSGYHLKHVKEFDTIENGIYAYQALYLMRDNSKISLLNRISYELPSKNLGFINGDFENNFILASSYGTGPSSFGLFKKDSGKELFKGFLIDVVESDNVFIYREFDLDSVEGNFFVYDVKSGQKNMILLPFDIDKDCLENYVCLKIESYDGTELSASYTNDEFEEKRVGFEFSK